MTVVVSTTLPYGNSLLTIKFTLCPSQLGSNSENFQMEKNNEKLSVYIKKKNLEISVRARNGKEYEKKINFRIIKDGYSDFIEKNRLQARTVCGGFPRKW